MLHALLEGKLSREQENMEDILTSTVFGAFCYSDPNAGLLPFLQGAHEVQACRAVMLEDLRTSRISYADYAFWPWLQEPGCNGCEPDVLIRLDTSSGGRYMVLVEAKYHSAKSAIDPEDGMARTGVGEAGHPVDQLAREWDNLRLVAEREQRAAVLLYVSTDMICPTDALAESQGSLQRHGREKGCFVWASWRWLPRMLATSSEHILRDTARVMARLGLRAFEGFTAGQESQAGCTGMTWSFAKVGRGTQARRRFAWVQPAVAERTWRFVASSGSHFGWPEPHVTLSWRFYR